jgi:putative transposase
VGGWLGWFDAKNRSVHRSRYGLPRSQPWQRPHRLFHKDEHYDAFERVLAEALGRYPIELMTYCLMPNHWHLVVRPGMPLALGRMMGWVGVTHVRPHHEHYHRHGAGHLYQGRYKSFPVDQDEYFLTLCRYVEANALRANLVQRAES